MCCCLLCQQKLVFLDDEASILSWDWMICLLTPEFLLSCSTHRCIQLVSNPARHHLFINLCVHCFEIPICTPIWPFVVEFNTLLHLYHVTISLHEAFPNGALFSFSLMYAGQYHCFHAFTCSSTDVPWISEFTNSNPSCWLIGAHIFMQAVLLFGQYTPQVQSLTFLNFAHSSFGSQSNCPIQNLDLFWNQLFCSYLLDDWGKCTIFSLLVSSLYTGSNSKILFCSLFFYECNLLVWFNWISSSGTFWKASKAIVSNLLFSCSCSNQILCQSFGGGSRDCFCCCGWLRCHNDHYTGWLLPLLCRC